MLAGVPAGKHPGTCPSGAVVDPACLAAELAKHPDHPPPPAVNDGPVCGIGVLAGVPAGKHPIPVHQGPWWTPRALRLSLRSIPITPSSSRTAPSDRGRLTIAWSFSGESLTYGRPAWEPLSVADVTVSSRAGVVALAGTAMLAAKPAVVAAGAQAMRARVRVIMLRRSASRGRFPHRGRAVFASMSWLQASPANQSDWLPSPPHGASSPASEIPLLTLRRTRPATAQASSSMAPAENERYTRFSVGTARCPQLIGPLSQRAGTKHFPT